ncbi:MAG: hypothetical protein ACUVWX_04150 [Kiritimatiellia bacterium]
MIMQPHLTVATESSSIPIAGEKLLVVFAGGPHTRSRMALASHLTEKLDFREIIFTGNEFLAISPSTLTTIAAGRRSTVEGATTTVESCRKLAQNIRRGRLAPAQVVAVTSNYHRPRLWWLLRGALPSAVDLQIHAASDLRFRDFFSSRTARRLILGEVASWIYCLPLGLWWRIHSVS